jgi:hypothetical protein
LLAVTVFLAIAFAAFLFENDYFVTFDVRKHAGFDAGARDVWRADPNLPIVFEQVNDIKRNCVAFIGCQPVDEDLLTFLNFELLTGDGNDSEHVLLNFL